MEAAKTIDAYWEGVLTDPLICAQAKYRSWQARENAPHGKARPMSPVEGAHDAARRRLAERQAALQREIS